MTWSHTVASFTQHLQCFDHSLPSSFCFSTGKNILTPETFHYRSRDYFLLGDTACHVQFSILPCYWHWQWMLATCGNWGHISHHKTFTRVNSMLQTNWCMQGEHHKSYSRAQVYFMQMYSLHIMELNSTQVSNNFSFLLDQFCSLLTGPCRILGCYYKHIHYRRHTAWHA